MVKLNFNIHAHRFKEGLTVQLATYRAASARLLGDIDRATGEAVDYRHRLKQGGEWVGELDESGNVLWDQEAVLGLRIEAAQDALATLRKAFAIAAYHHWERSVRAFTRRENGKHDDLVKAAARHGVSVHRKLGAVRDLVNLLKHDNDKRADDLRKSWSELLPSETKRPYSGWYDAVCLLEPDIDEVYQIVAASGPACASVSATKA